MKMLETVVFNRKKIETFRNAMFEMSKRCNVLKNRGVKIGIVSNKFQSAAEDVCKHYFDGLYDAVVGESDLCKRKPAPDGINMICEQFGVDKDDAIFFGDSEVDVKTGENAGVYCVSVLWGYRDKEFLARNGAKLFVSNPLDIVDMIG